MNLLTRKQSVRYNEIKLSKWLKFLEGDGGLWNGGAVPWVSGKGGEVMPDVPDELEIERVKNLITAFGWAISKTELKTDRIILTIENKRTAAEAEASPGPE